MQNGNRGKMVEFIKVEKDNIKDLAAFAKDIWFEYWHSIITLGQIYYMVNRFQSEMALTEQIERENYTYYFIVENGQKIGYFGYYPNNDHIFLSKFYMVKDYRGKGFGKIAFEKIKEITKENNFNKIQLTVSKQNFKSHAIYEKWGFKTLHPLVTRIGNGYEMDDYLMEYTL